MRTHKLFNLRYLMNTRQKSLTWQELYQIWMKTLKTMLLERSSKQVCICIGIKLGQEDFLIQTKRQLDILAMN